MKHIFVTALLCLILGKPGTAQRTSTPIKTIRPGASDLKSVNLKTLTIEQIRSGSHKGLPLFNKLELLASMPNRFNRGTIINSGVRQGRNAAGVQYYISRNDITLPPNSTGTVRRSGDHSPNNFLICESSLVNNGVEFASSMLGIPSSNSDESRAIFPGVLFRDQDVVNGRFIPVTLPRRPSTLGINVVNAQSILETVSNFNDKNTVNQARSVLLNRIGNSNANTDHFSFSYEVRSGSELAMDFQTSMNVNLAELLGIPASVGNGIGSGVQASTEFNTAVAFIRNVNYVLSVGGGPDQSGPEATIEGPIPPDVLCVGDVAYGNMAFIVVRNLATRAEAKLVAEELLRVTGLGGASTNLSASARLAFSTSAVSVMVYGGAGASTVNNIQNIEQLRAELARGNNTVAGVNAMPLYYTLYYAAGNAPAKIAAFASFTNTTCYRASQLEVSLESFKPTAVVDFGDEELFGTVQIMTEATSRTNNNKFWSIAENKAVTGTQGRQISGLTTNKLVFNVNPALVDPNQSIITIFLEIKDKIMPEEMIGASAAARSLGYVNYGPKNFTLDMREVQDAGPNGILKTCVVSEGNAQIEAKVRFKLIR